jgi:DNA-binding XRE family transcriptional regulator
VGPRPTGMEAAHNNGNPADNSLSNLRWDTHTGNCADKKIHGTQQDQRGEKSHGAKLTAEKVKMARRLYEKGVMQKDIAQMFGVSKGTMNVAIHGKTWTNV